MKKMIYFYVLSIFNSNTGHNITGFGHAEDMYLAVILQISFLWY